MTKSLLIIVFSTFNLTAEATITLPNLPQSLQELDKFIKNAKTSAIPDLHNLKDCTYRGSMIINSYQNFKDNWFKSDHDKTPIIDVGMHHSEDYSRYNLSLKDNFEALYNQENGVQKEFTKLVNEFIAKYSDKEFKNLTSIQDARTDFHRDYRILYAKLLRLSEKETRYLKMVHFVEDKAYLLRSRLNNDSAVFLSSKCRTFGSEKVGALIENDLKSLLSNSNRFHAFVTDVRRARTKYLNYIFRTIDAYFQQTHRDKGVEILSSTADELQAVLELNKLTGEIIDWIFRESLGGLANSEHTLFLQYEVPLRYLRSLIGQISIYRDRVKASNTHILAHGTVLRKLNEFQLIIQGDIDWMLKRGWEGTLARQRLLTEHRFKIIHKYPNPADCEAELTKYMTRSDSINSIEQYRVVENLYKQSLMFCTGKL